MKKLIGQRQGGPPIATQVGSLLFFSGLDPKSLEHPGTIHAPGDIAEQTDYTIFKLETYLQAANCSLGDVVKVTAYIDDMKNWAAFNEAYNRRFADDSTRPSRTTLPAGAFENGMCIELDVIAVARD